MAQVVRKKDTRRKNHVARVKVEREVMASAEHTFVVKLFYSFQSADNLCARCNHARGDPLTESGRGPLWIPVGTW